MSFLLVTFAGLLAVPVIILFCIEALAAGTLKRRLLSVISYVVDKLPAYRQILCRDGNRLELIARRPEGTPSPPVPCRTCPDETSLRLSITGLLVRRCRGCE
jgi:hypothetical protein